MMFLWNVERARCRRTEDLLTVTLCYLCIFAPREIAHQLAIVYLAYVGVRTLSMIDRLIEDKDKKAAEKPKKDYEIKRWSKMYGEPCIVELHALDTQLFEEIADNAVSYTKSGKVKGVNNFNAGARIVINGVYDKETGKPFFKDAKLMKHFGAATPFDLVDVLLLPGEMGAIAAELNKLSGVGEEADTDEVVKN